jgi:hypothetical protein
MLENLWDKAILPACQRQSILEWLGRASLQDQSAKVGRLLGLLDEFPDKLVIFTQFRATQEMLRRHLAQAGYSLSPTAIASIRRVRTMNCPQALFWFKATFVSDQKEEEILLMGMDLHSLREVRHWDSLLASSGLSELPETHLPEARHGGLMAGYRCARDRLAPSVAALANTRRREWSGRVATQIQRMSAYYSRLREEANESFHNGDDAAPSRIAARRDRLGRTLAHRRVAAKVQPSRPSQAREPDDRAATEIAYVRGHYRQKSPPRPVGGRVESTVGSHRSPDLPRLCSTHLRLANLS